MGYTTDGADEIRSLWRTLEAAWTGSADAWRDEVRREFERRFCHDLGAAAEEYERALDDLERELQASERVQG